MKPQVAIDTVLGYASILLRRPLSEGQAAEAGADHLVVFATTPARERVVIKVGEDAHADAYVLEQLRDRPVKAPRPLAQGTLRVGGSNYPLAIMTFVEGEALAALTGEQHRHLPAIIAEMDQVHRITTTRGAGPVLQIAREGTAPIWFSVTPDDAGVTPHTGCGVVTTRTWPARSPSA